MWVVIEDIYLYVTLGLETMKLGRTVSDFSSSENNPRYLTIVHRRKLYEIDVVTWRIIIYCFLLSYSGLRNFSFLK